MSTTTIDLKLLNYYRRLLGDGLEFFYPFIDSTLGAGADVTDWGPYNHMGNNVVALDEVPFIRGSILALHLNGTDEYISLGDHARFSNGDGVDDNCFSVAAWVNMDTITDNAILAKWDDTTAALEWRF